MNIAVLGAGAWGTALAVAASTNQSVCLWARDPSQAESMQVDRTNRKYLSEAVLPTSLQVTSDFDRACQHARGASGLIILATPTAALQDVLRQVNAVAAPGSNVLWLCKGLQDATGRLGHEVAADVSSGLRLGVLSGPSFALEVARGQPTALVVASRDQSLCERAVEALHSECLRIYTSTDPIGVEVGGAVKNILAIATGISDGLQLGFNARAALITRGLAEMMRLGSAMGAQAETFMGLSGLGDLVLTATGDLSRNRKVGVLLAQGMPLEQILSELGHVAEGVRCAVAVHNRAQSLGVEMPITQGLVAVLRGEVSPKAALSRLMGRQARSER